MIQLNTTSTSGAQDSSASLLPPPQSQAGDGFQTALSAALSSTLQKFGINPNNVTLSITPAKAAVSAVTPFSAAANEGSAASTTPVVSATPAASTTPATPTSTTTTSTAGSSSGESEQSFDDAYWAAQPPAVQALRNVDDYNQRTQLAAKLSAQGYNIDVPIMVYGWDPAKITAARESYGYTWVPSAMQQPIAEAPGISTPGATAYDPKNPPAGSIAV
jgi:hypothetical protein